MGNQDTWRIIVVEQGAGKVSILDPVSGTTERSVDVGYNPHEIALRPDGKTAYVTNFGIEDYDHTIGTPGTDIAVIDLSAMKIVTALLTNSSPAQKDNQAPHGVKLRPQREEELFVNVEVGDSMLVYDLPTGKIKRSFSLPAGAHNFLFSPNGDTIFLFAGSLGVFSIDPDSGAQLDHLPTATAIRGLHYTNDGRYLIVSGINEIYLVNPADLSVDRHFTDLGVKQIIYSSPTPDEQSILAPCPYDNLVLLVDLESGEVKKRIATGKAPIYVQIAPSGKEAIVANALDTFMSSIDLEDYSVRSIGELNRPNGFAFIAGL
ncbi:MAG: YncE family protein [Saprospiraceae bacterium]|nr:YncE family protein [Lewinella sp.]